MNDEGSAHQTRSDQRTREEIVAAVGRSMLVEAAAGTGKTTLIVARLLHGLRVGAFRLARAVAITFTEKAAGELEGRLRRELSALSRNPELDPEERSRLVLALEEIDCAAIGTIHSFCASLLRERPVEAGVDPQFDVLDQTRSDLLVERCWERWIEEQMAECPPALLDALRAGANVVGGQYSSGLRDIARTLTDMPEVMETSHAGPQRPARKRGESMRLLGESAPRALRFLEQNGRGEGNKHYRHLCRLLDGLDAGAPETTLTRRAYALCTADLCGPLTSLHKEARKEAGEMLLELRGPCAELGAHLAADVFDWMRGFVEYYRAEKRRLSVLDFKDLLYSAYRMLRDNKSARRYFAERFDAFFVDEFQDTDPLQAEIIAFLCGRPAAVSARRAAGDVSSVPDGRESSPAGGPAGTGTPADRMEDVTLEEGKLFVVGDPKQSIYRFRGADVEVYERFKGLFGKAGVRGIFRNFRSTAPLLAGFNDIFRELMRPSEVDRVYQAEHVELVPREGPAETESPPSLIAICPPPSLLGNMGKAQDARACEARCVARAIKAIVEGDPSVFPRIQKRQAPAFSEVAFLFRTLKAVDTYEKGLDQYGIPYRVTGGRSFYARQEIGETLAVLRAVDDPLDEVAAVAALRSSYFAVSDEDLLQFKLDGGRWNYLLNEVTNGPAGEAMCCLAGWHRRVSSTVPHVLLGEILGYTKALEAYLMKPLGQQRVANVLKLLAQLRALWTASNSTFRGVVDYVASLQERGQEEEESTVVEAADDFVRIMSMHRAKGLAFDTVVLPDLARQFRREAGAVLADRASRRVEVAVRKGIESLGFRKLKAVEEANTRAEQVRLLYVACTRARSRVLLPLYWQSQRHGDCLLQILLESGRFAEPGDVPYGEEREGVFYADTARWEKEIAQGRPARPKIAATPPASVEGMVEQREKWRENRRSLIRRVSSVPPIVAPSAEAERDGVPFTGAEGGREIGAVFHAVMRRAPLRELGDGEDAKELLQSIARREAAPWADDAHVAKAAGLALRCAEDPEFRSLLSGAQTVRREVPFCVPLRALRICEDSREGLTEGSIDLLLIAGAHTVILDYKTDALEASEVEARARLYWPQLALYALAIESFGYPVDEAELILYFVTPGKMVRRECDDELVQEAAARLCSVPAY